MGSECYILVASREMLYQQYYVHFHVCFPLPLPLTPNKYMDTCDEAFCKKSPSRVRNRASTKISGTTPEFPNAQQTFVALPSTVSDSIPNRGSRTNFEAKNKAKQCTMATTGMVMEVLSNP